MLEGGEREGGCPLFSTQTNYEDMEHKQPQDDDSLACLNPALPPMERYAESAITWVDNWDAASEGIHNLEFFPAYLGPPPDLYSNFSPSWSPLQRQLNPPPPQLPIPDQDQGLGSHSLPGAQSAASYSPNLFGDFVVDEEPVAAWPVSEFSFGAPSQLIAPGVRPQPHPLSPQPSGNIQQSAGTPSSFQSPPKPPPTPTPIEQTWTLARPSMHRCSFCTFRHLNIGEVE